MKQPQLLPEIFSQGEPLETIDSEREVLIQLEFAFPRTQGSGICMQFDIAESNNFREAYKRCKSCNKTERGGRELDCYAYFGEDYSE